MFHISKCKVKTKLSLGLEKQSACQFLGKQTIGWMAFISAIKCSQVSVFVWL